MPQALLYLYKRYYKELFKCMPRKYKPISCSKTDIIALRQWADDDASPRLAVRAKIVLKCAEGLQVKDIADELGERPNTVILWRNRFSEGGLGGLLNRPRGSNANKYGTDLNNRILHLIKEAPPDGVTRWTGKTIANELGIPPDVVWRCLRKERIHPADRDQQEDTDPSPEQSAPFMDIPLRITIQEDAYMSKQNNQPSDKMDLEIIARIKGKDGTVIEKKIQLDDAIPNAADFDISTLDGFRRDFDQLEKSILKARNDLSEELAGEYMDTVSKKNRSRKKQ